LKAQGVSVEARKFSCGKKLVENFLRVFSQRFLANSADPKTPANVELYERFVARFDHPIHRSRSAKQKPRGKQHIETALERGEAEQWHAKSDELKR